LPSSQIKTSVLYPVFGGNGIRGYIDTPNFEGECVIIGRQGAFCGNVRYFSGPAYMTEHAVVLTTKPQHNTRYLAYLLSTMNLGRLSAQSAQPGLSVHTLAKQIVTLPALSTQIKIASILSVLDKKISLNTQINRNLENLAA
jgi:type I restriction enzyme S subunit